MTRREKAETQGAMFGVKVKRFGKSDTLPPGPGQYKAQDSCVVQDLVPVAAAFKSKTARELELVIGKDNPGVAKYNLTDHLSIGVKKIEGGAPNNFLILTQNNDPLIRRREPKESPRVPELQQNSK